MSTPTLKGTILVVMGFSHGRRVAVAGHSKLSILYYCVFVCFQPLLSRWLCALAHGKSQNALKNCHFGTKNGSKMGQKLVKNVIFPNVILHHLGC